MNDKPTIYAAPKGQRLDLSQDYSMAASKATKATGKAEREAAERRKAQSTIVR